MISKAGRGVAKPSASSLGSALAGLLDGRGGHMVSSCGISIQAAREMGARGGEPLEDERLLFEAWMSGHCWLVAGVWNGETYEDPSETKAGFNPAVMLTRQLWAVWRDRAALDRAKSNLTNSV